jgi:DNA invertase Pin-like site-specific DNA recombinase
MNVVAWARVSSREQREGYSLDAQLRAMRDRAVKNNWTVVREFVVAESAKRGAERTVFNQMFKWVRENARREKIQAILSHKLDRVCRNMRDAVRLQELEDDCGVQLAFVENQFGPGAAGALSFNVMAAVAQYYSDNLRSEVLKGMDEKVRQGWPTGHAPYGYLNVEDKDEPIIPHPEKGKTLARMFELFATGLYTLKDLSKKLNEEGHTFRGSMPKFPRTSLSYYLNNRFYIGDLLRNGMVYPGKYKLLIDRQTFDACQDILKGKNRRTGNPELMFSGCVFRCAVCGSAMTGEVINRKLRHGGSNPHVYYKCSNNYPAPDHPMVRWREEDIEAAIVKELDSIRIPVPEIAGWFRNTIAEAFANVREMQEQQKKLLSKRKSELANMQERLLNGYLMGVVDEAAFKTKSAEFKRETEEVARQMEDVGKYDASRGDLALSVFDFSQNLANLWRGSNFAVRREILECISSNRELGHLTLCVAKRRPFDFLAERPFLEDSRGNCPNFEPKKNIVEPVLEIFAGQILPYLLMARRIAENAA